MLFECVKNYTKLIKLLKKNMAEQNRGWPRSSLIEYLRIYN